VRLTWPVFGTGDLVEAKALLDANR